MQMSEYMIKLLPEWKYFLYIFSTTQHNKSWLRLGGAAEKTRKGDWTCSACSDQLQSASQA